MLCDIVQESNGHVNKEKISRCSSLTFALLSSAAEGSLLVQWRPGQRVDLILVSAQAMHDLPSLGDVNQRDHAIFVPGGEQS